jgi:hypothetical protein
MEKVINNGAAEKSSKIEDDKERWYLPIFGVYHPKKPNQVRGVFDDPHMTFQLLHPTEF